MVASSQRLPFPVKTIGVAISFSPYCLSVLEQAKSIADALSSSLVLIHIGEKTEEKEREINEMMRILKIDYDSSRMIWMEGKEVDTILKLCELNRVDLLVLGARMKEDIVSYYMGSVARKISRKAKCSVLLVTSPVKAPYKYNKVVVNGMIDPKSKQTINMALYFAQHLGTRELFIVNELETMFPLLGDTAGKISEVEKQTIQQQEDFVESLSVHYSEAKFTIENRTIKGKPGFAISKFARNKRADLLVVSSPNTKLNVMDRIFTHDMEYILADLPSNLLIVYSKE